MDRKNCYICLLCETHTEREWEFLNILNGLSILGLPRPRCGFIFNLLETIDPSILQWLNFGFFL